MFKNVRMTLKKLLSDKRGEDLAEVSSGLSKGAKTMITLGVITGVSAGAAAMTNTMISAENKASKDVIAPGGAQADTAAKTKAVYSP